MDKSKDIKLMFDSFSGEEFEAINNCLKSGFYTQGRLVEEFEEKFAKWNGSKYAVMVNSGSSANLIAVKVLKERCGLQDGDEILVPAVTWPTTIYPIIQNNLKPVFCDVGSDFNISIDSIRRMVSKKTRALFLVHLLGQPADLGEIQKFCEENDITLIEDCCESLGGTYGATKVGNFGVMGTFSFYFGHHITTVEGGMVVTDDEDFCDLLKSSRSHGWVRGSRRANRYRDEFPDQNFVFDTTGYNLRSTNINAAIGLAQLKKLDMIIERRKLNHKLFSELMAGSKVKLQRAKLNQTSSFSLALIVGSRTHRDKLLAELPKQNIECRPIVAGNMLKQPVFRTKLHNLYRSDGCPYADQVHDRGLYLPNNQFIDEDMVRRMALAVRRILGEQ